MNTSATRITFLEKVGYGSGDMAANFLFHTWNLFLLKFYIDVFGISADAAAAMFLYTRFIDIITDPLMGIIADRTRTRWGKYRPYVLFGSIPLGIVGFLMFVTPDIQGDSKLIYAWVSYSLAMFFYTLVQIPYSALMGVTTPNSEERLILSKYRFFLAFGGQLLIGFITLPLVEYVGGDTSSAKGWAITMGLFALIGTLIYFFTFATTKERVVTSAEVEEQSKDVVGNLKALLTNVGWLVMFVSAFFNLAHVAIRNGSFAFYFDYYLVESTSASSGSFTFTALVIAVISIAFCYCLFSEKHPKPKLIAIIAIVTLAAVGGYYLINDHLLALSKSWKNSVFYASGTIAFMLGILCSNFLTARFGKKNLLITVSLIPSVLISLFYFIAPDQYELLLGLHWLTSFITGPIPVLLYAMYADIADYVEWKTGRNVMALVFATTLIGVKLGLTIGASLQAKYLDFLNYVPNEAQTPEVQQGLVLMVSVFPGVLVLLSGLTILFYPYTEKFMQPVVKELAERRGDREQDHTPVTSPGG